MKKCQQNDSMSRPVSPSEESDQAEGINRAPPISEGNSIPIYGQGQLDAIIAAIWQKMNSTGSIVDRMATPTVPQGSSRSVNNTDHHRGGKLSSHERKITSGKANKRVNMALSPSNHSASDMEVSAGEQRTGVESQSQKKGNMDDYSFQHRDSASESEESGTLSGDEADGSQSENTPIKPRHPVESHQRNKNTSQTRRATRTDKLKAPFRQRYQHGPRYLLTNCPPEPLPFDMEGPISLSEYFVIFENYTIRKYGDDATSWPVILQTKMKGRMSQSFDRHGGIGAPYDHLKERLLADYDYAVGSGAIIRSTYDNFTFIMGTSLYHNMSRLLLLFKKKFPGVQARDCPGLMSKLESVVPPHHRKILYDLKVEYQIKGQTLNWDQLEILVRSRESDMEIIQTAKVNVGPAWTSTETDGESLYSKSTCHDQPRTDDKACSSFKFQTTVDRREQQVRPKRKRDQKKKWSDGKCKKAKVLVDSPRNTERRFGAEEICVQCNRRGHKAHNCYWINGLCLNCGSDQHMIRQCPNQRRANTKQDICQLCDKIGHSALQCYSVRDRTSSGLHSTSSPFRRESYRYGSESAAYGQGYRRNIQGLPFSHQGTAGSSNNVKYGIGYRDNHTNSAGNISRQSVTYCKFCDKSGHDTLKCFKLENHYRREIYNKDTQTSKVNSSDKTLSAPSEN